MFGFGMRLCGSTFVWIESPFHADLFDSIAIIFGFKAIPSSTVGLLLLLLSSFVVVVVTM